MKVKFWFHQGIVLVLFLQSACAQYHRDSLHYKAAYRGEEKYYINGLGNEDQQDSLSAANNRNEHEIKLYIAHKKAYENRYDLLGEIKSASTGSASAKDVKKQPSPEDQEKASDPEPKKAHDKDKQSAKQRPQIISQDPSSTVTNTTYLDKIWPENFLKEFITRASSTSFDSAAVSGLINALSSNVSIAEMRDLLTEPSFPSLLPMERKIVLKCFPPPESAVFESVSKITASLEQQDKLKTGLGTEFSTSVVKLFEESERTLFLQYALFRLCEMSLNAPAGFKNIYPVIIHDLVRRTAEMRDLANKEAEVRLAEEQKSKQLELQYKLKKADIYSKCVDEIKEKSKEEDLSKKNETIVKECEKRIKALDAK